MNAHLLFYVLFSRNFIKECDLLNDFFAVDYNYKFTCLKKIIVTLIINGL